MSKPSFLQFMQERDQLEEAFNSAPYELTMGKKNAGDVFFTFVDEDEKEYRIQFYTPQGLGKSVRQVFIGQKRGSVYPDAIARFKNPMRVIASMIEATKQFMATPLGKTIDGFAVNFSKKALDRGMTLIPKIIRQSGLKQKLNVMDLTYAPVPDRGYVWLVRKGKDPAQVFDGPKMQGITWDDPDKVGDVPPERPNVPAGSDPSNPANELPDTLYVNGGIAAYQSVEAIVNGNQVDIAVERGKAAVSVTSERLATLFKRLDIDTVSVDVKVRSGRYPNIYIEEKNGVITIANSVGKNMVVIRKSKSNSVSQDAFSGDSTAGATSIDQLKDSGFIARVLGIIDTNVGLDTSILPGENIRRVGAGRYTTAGGLVIVVNFTNVLAGFVQYSVFSEIAEEENVAKGSARDVANAVIASIFEVAKTQYTGEWEIGAVPTSAPYPIKAIRHSQGWGYVETANWTLKVSDAVLNRVKPGNTALLELIKEPPRGKHLLEIIPEKGDKTLMLKDRITGAIYGSIDLNAQGADLVNSGTLKMPRNAMVFGETVNGMSIRWDVNFPETGKYAGASMITNVTYYYDKGKVAFTPIVSQKGRTLNNPKTYELPLNKDMVQSVIDEISSKMVYLSRNLQQLKSQSYNPNQVFLNDITITDKGEVIWNDYNLSDGKVTQIMLSMISAENKRLEKVANTPDINITLPKKQAEVVEFINRMIDIDLTPYVRTPKKRDVVLFDSSELSINQLNNIERLGRETGKWSLQSNGGMGHALFLKSTSHNPKDDLAAYADSIRDNAPKGRDLDWQIYASRDGQTLNVDWDITFRRNTTEGAYREFKAQIDRANQYLQTLYQDAKSKGYNPTEPNLMTLARAQQSDQWSQDNGESAYSEYEQSLGGNMQIKI